MPYGEMPYVKLPYVKPTYGEMNSGDDKTALRGAACGRPNSCSRRLTTLVRCSPTTLTETMSATGRTSSPSSRCGTDG